MSIVTTGTDHKSSASFTLLIAQGSLYSQSHTHTHTHTHLTAEVQPGPPKEGLKPPTIPQPAGMDPGQGDSISPASPRIDPTGSQINSLHPSQI